MFDSQSKWTLDEIVVFWWEGMEPHSECNPWVIAVEYFRMCINSSDGMEPHADINQLTPACWVISVKKYFQKKTHVMCINTQQCQWQGMEPYTEFKPLLSDFSEKGVFQVTDFENTHEHDGGIKYLI